MSAWNFADVWEVVSDRCGDEVALAHGGHRVTWRAFDRRADSLAAFLLDAGLGRQAKVAQYLVNGPEYLETMFAAFKSALVPVNTNYRYGPAELLDLWQRTDVEAVVLHGRFTDTAAEVRSRIEGVRVWIHVDDGTGPCPPWAVPYEEVASAHTPRVTPSWGRSPDDLFLLCTGGTTGFPKGVMWRQDDVFARMNSGAVVRYPEEGDLADVEAVVAPGGGPVHLPASPLMHGTGAITSMSTLAQGGRVVTLTGRFFDAVELLDAVDGDRVTTIAIVGDMFARPIVERLDADPSRWDISSLRQVMSSGVAWSLETQRQLLRHHPDLVIIDAFGSSEAIGIGRVVRTGSADGEARFRIPATTRVLGDDGTDVAPGSGRVGRVAVTGRIPLGYYKDPEASARAFPEIQGVRHSVPGDFATVEADGTMRLLGRGSQCINTGGEKVFVEEVEDVLRTHAAVADAAVVGVPDPTWGQAVCALVQPERGRRIDVGDVITHVKAHLAGYKAPRRVLVVDSLARGPHGKVDYKALAALAASDSHREEIP